MSIEGITYRNEASQLTENIKTIAYMLAALVGGLFFLFFMLIMAYGALGLISMLT